MTLNRLDSAYRKSHYRIPGHYDFRIGGPAHGVRGVIITAWNPHSGQMSPWKNHHRQCHLTKSLHRMGYQFSRAWCGVDDWWEESLLVHDMDTSAAYQMARQFEQHAFVFLDARRVWLIYLR
ncbi:DUF3293 domain-containing protein [Acidithiobacillus sp. M4-SHS-6]|uniref:DUF3293 domain-containing protein n=1 Tax=Acidithiobacillus sp. M4-SHS-6 TaxID=3383024 RepID=UPI0039BEB72D